MAINDIVQYTTSGFLTYILLLTQAPILVWFDDDTIIIESSTILLTGPHAFGPKNIYFVLIILMKQPHDCSY